MTDQLLILSSIVLFLVVGLLAKNKTDSIELFSTKRNQLSWFVTTAGVSMTFVGGAAILNMASLGYRYGWYTLIDPLAFIIGILAAGISVSYYRNNKGITISHLLSGSDKKLSLYIGIVSSVFSLLIISAQFVAFSKLLSPYFPDVNPVFMIVVPAAIIFLYVLMGGFAAVTKTDVLQLFFILLFLLAPVVYYKLSSENTSPIGGEALHTFATMPADLIIFMGIFIFFVPFSQDINIRAKSAKNESHARIGILLSGIIYCLVVIACSFIGVTLAKHGLSVDDPEKTYPAFFKTFFPRIGIVAILAAMAALWSTVDTYFVNCTTSIAEDILKKTSYLSRLTERKLIMIAGLIVFFLSIIISLYSKEVLSIVLTALLVYISVLVPIAIGRKIKLGDSIIFYVSVLTVTGMLICEVMGADISPKAVIYPVGAILLMTGGWIMQRISVRK